MNKMNISREYVFGYLSTLKLIEMEINGLLEEEIKWEKRISLARNSEDKDLLEYAISEWERVKIKKTALENEAAELMVTIDNLKKELMVMPAKERSVDPDLLEQELLILCGRMPGEEKQAEQDRNFEKLEKETAASAALKELKEKMGK